MSCLNTLRNIRDAVDDIDIDDLLKLEKVIEEHNHIFIIGNGGSNAIAQHMAIDYTKFLNKRCHAFGDSPRITCYMNDYGVENAYKQYLLDFATKNSLVILISSSGESKNIVKCAEFCDRNELSFVTLTGFEPDNLLRRVYGKKANVDIWVDSNSYSVVECTHEIYLHSVVGN